jgi:hypothetical protein
MTSRLGSISSDLVARIENATASKQREIALKAAEFAIDQTGLNAAIAIRAFLAAKDGRFAVARRTELADLVSELDGHQFEVGERVEDGGASQEQYLSAFALARAATAVYCATDGDAKIAALEAAYEAAMTVDDPQELIAILRASLTD